MGGTSLALASWVGAEFLLGASAMFDLDSTLSMYTDILRAAALIQYSPTSSHESLWVSIL